jgi:asparagine synthase (glutamine-hydrolysing)
VGGVIILDDYDAWSGCKKAADEYFDGKLMYFELDDSMTSLKVTRLRQMS